MAVSGDSKKSGDGLDEIPTFNAENMLNNARIITYSRTFMSIIGGVIAGILGFTSLTGFIFYFVVMAITTVGLAAKAKFSVGSYFDSWNRIIFDGILGGLLSFVLFWSLDQGVGVIRIMVSHDHFLNSLNLFIHSFSANSTMNSSNSKHGFFPEDVVLQILARLPIKPLYRTKCVCKSWHKIIADNYFTNLFNEISLRSPMVLVEITEPTPESRSSLILVDNSSGVSEFSLDFINDRVKVRASCNGLLCCSSIPDKGVYYVCNPMTREFRLLPRNRERPVTRFHPDGEATLVGLACDVVTQRYSVVLAGYHRSFGHRPERTFMCMVFDSGSSKWRKFVTLQDDHFTHMNRNQVVFINGALHWLTSSCLSVLVLDLNSEAWRKISLPDQLVSGSGNRIYLLESDGMLSVIQISDVSMSIWVVEDYEREVWSLVDRVSLRCIRGMVPGIFPISQTGKYVFLATHKQVLVYQRENRVWTEMYSVKNSSTLPLWFSAYAFRSTIFSC